ncbi:hypothetical protein [Rhodococcus sp. NPDC049939]|uniref:hypothetical protein n=1 Tax=Rhodococcus sp. NPDC049939 TaxID=3155511 RepID=UPI0033F074A4
MTARVSSGYSTQRPGLLVTGALGLRPAKHVQEVLDIPSATATRWIRRARELPIFDSATATGEEVVDGDD